VSECLALFISTAESRDAPALPIKVVVIGLRGAVVLAQDISIITCRVQKESKMHPEF
jgi:hypothetical protein